MEALSNEEAFIILQGKKQTNAERNLQNNEVLESMLGYLEKLHRWHFDQGTLQDRADNFRLRMSHLNLLSEDGQNMPLHSHEIAALSNLFLTTAYDDEDEDFDNEDCEDEMKALIPSLERYNAEQMAEIISVMRENAREFRN